MAKLYVNDGDAADPRIAQRWPQDQGGNGQVPEEDAEALPGLIERPRRFA